MQRVTLAVVLLIALGGGLAHAQNVIKADYVETHTNRDGETRTVHGTHYFSMSGDGLYRHDRRFAGEHTTEIWRPDSQQRLTVNRTLGVAHRGHWSRSWNIPSRRVGGMGSAHRPQQLPPELVARMASVTVQGGDSRTVGPLVLVRMGGGEPGSHTNAMWGVMPGTIPGLAILPILEEYQYERSETGNLTAIRLTSVVRIAVSPSFFDLPSGLSVEDLGGPLDRGPLDR